MSVKILPFRNKHQPLVDQLLQDISNEFEESMFSAASVPMKNVAHVIGNQFWVAMDHDLLIGTIGVIRKKNKNAMIKSMFVEKAYRGKDVAIYLLNHAVNFCKRRGIKEIYLGTMSQMKAAQKFYEKNGFVSIEKKDLPSDLIMNPVDDVFYRLMIVL